MRYTSGLRRSSVITIGKLAQPYKIKLTLASGEENLSVSEKPSPTTFQALFTKSEYMYLNHQTRAMIFLNPQPDVSKVFESCEYVGGVYSESPSIAVIAAAIGKSTMNTKEIIMNPTTNIQ